MTLAVLTFWTLFITLYTTVSTSVNHQIQVSQPLSHQMRIYKMRLSAGRVRTLTFLALHRWQPRRDFLKLSFGA